MKPYSQRGQASVEHVGLILLAALALATAMALGPLPALDLPATLAKAILPGQAGTPTPSGAVVPTPAAERYLVEDLMAAELSEFLGYRSAPDRDLRLDYSTDGCTAPVVGNAGRTYDFTAACLRHDFGYRNYGRLGLIGERRRSVDERFLADMQAHCATRPRDEVVSCLGWARDYFRAVRVFGWLPASRYD